LTLSTKDGRNTVALDVSGEARALVAGARAVALLPHLHEEPGTARAGAAAQAIVGLE
jgi:hypothetical protein